MEERCHLSEIFEDKGLTEKIRNKLPYLFQLAELDSQRAGKAGMEVGSTRERIIIALLIYKFGQDKIETEIPITETEIDVKLNGNPISIKTITGPGFSGVKVIWTVDAQKAKEFLTSYYPKCDILLVQINWGSRGGFYYIPLEVQNDIFQQLGRENYIKLPKAGTNPRGVEFNREALVQMIRDKRTMCVEIEWTRSKISFNPYKRWVDLWKED